MTPKAKGATKHRKHRKPEKKYPEYVHVVECRSGFAPRAVEWRLSMDCPAFSRHSAAVSASLRLYQEVEGELDYRVATYRRVDTP